MKTTRVLLAASLALLAMVSCRSVEVCAACDTAGETCVECAGNSDCEAAGGSCTDCSEAKEEKAP